MPNTQAMGRMSCAALVALVPLDARAQQPSPDERDVSLGILGRVAFSSMGADGIGSEPRIVEPALLFTFTIRPDR